MSQPDNRFDKFADRVANTPKLESQWPGSQRDGGHSCPGNEMRHCSRPGRHWKLGSFQWPLGSSDADLASGEPTMPGFSQCKRERRGGDGPGVLYPQQSRAVELVHQSRARDNNNTTIYQQTSQSQICHRCNGPQRWRISGSRGLAQYYYIWWA